MTTIALPYEQQLTTHNKTLTRLAFSLTKNESAAEDLVQDTYVLALRFRDRYTPNTSLKAWLCRVMKNRYISILRRKNLERTTLAQEGPYVMQERFLSQHSRQTTEKDGNVDQGEGFCDTIQNAMGSIKPEHREVVQCCDIEELSYADTAKRLNKPLGTVMSRLHRGRNALRERLCAEDFSRAAA